MKKTILSAILAISFIGCTGEKGDVGPQGDLGAKGTIGTSGQTGAQGATGDKGPAGAGGSQGATGNQGPTPALGATFSDWADLGTWDNTSSSPVFYYTYRTASKSFLLSLIPNPDKLTISTFSDLGSYAVYNISTKEVAGTLYAFYSLITPENQQVIFNDTFENGTFNAYDLSLTGLLEIGANLKTTPKISQQLYLSFTESKYKPTDDLKAVLQNMKAKIRFIYIPLGLPAKNGRQSAHIKNYEELIEAYNIPR